MRPKCIDDIIGQDHILGENSLLKRLIQENNFGSLLFYGPPGVGKTSIAEVIANETNAHIVRLNAVLSNVAELREILRMARYRTDKATLLFLDEIHRFNKSQQDLLLPDVEEGNIRLIGATTHNPGFYINPPLLSRSHLFKLQPLEKEQIVVVLRKALTDEVRGLANTGCSANDAALEGIASFSDGDMRRALNALETIALSQPMGTRISEETVEAFAKERQIRYDRNEDEHYDTASALIKSIRGSDPDAALYWLAKMIEGGEDPRFIARRLVISASEDIGLGDSRALPVAVAAFQACEIIGMPECRINLAHATVFLATCPKSNRAYMGLNNAMEEIRKNPVQPIPLALRDGHTKLNKSLGHGKEYLYSHDYPENITGQDYMTDPKQFYFPGPNGAEASIGERLKHWKELKAKRKK
jgi:putative ATPase